MKLWILRYPDGRYQGSPLSAQDCYKTENPHLAATWRLDESKLAKTWAKNLGATAVLFLYEDGVMTEAISRERAQEIWDARGPFGEWPTTAYTTADGIYIRKVWDKGPGHHSWADALLSIAKGLD
jgi:hypothetical protein